MPAATSWEDVSRDHCRAWLAGLVEAGAAQDTRRARHGAVDRFLDWCVVEGEIPSNPMAGMTMPSPGRKPVPVIELDQLRLWIKQFSSRTFIDTRDEAIVRIFFDVDCGLQSWPNSA